MLHEVVLEVFEDPEDEGLDLVIKDPAAGPDRRVDEVVEVVFLVGDINDLRCARVQRTFRTSKGRFGPSAMRIPKSVRELLQAGEP